MQSHNRGQCTAKSLIVLAIWAASLLILGAGCGRPTPTPTVTPEPVVLEEAPSITLAPPGPTIEVQPREELAISARATGVEPQVSWTAKCLKDKNCQVLQETTGKDNFFTAPRTPDEQVIVTAAVKDKYGREDSATLTFKVQVPTPIETPTPTATFTPIPTDTPTAAPTDTPTLTDTPVPPLETLMPAPCQSTRPSLDGPPVNVEVQITSPRHCDSGLATAITAGGTYSGDLTGKEIWILVYPTDLKYYPQSLDACEGLPVDASGGIWNTRVCFGGPPQQYGVIAVVTDTDGEASQEFKRWLKRGCETDDFPGYPRNKLPGGITEVDAVTVTTASE